MGVDVSVVFCQYNPVYKKVIRSMYSLITQKEISFEIIVVDDGSSEDYFEQYNIFFEKHSFSNYILHKNPNNLGIVKNLLSGIKLAKGKYVFFNSPGDIIYNDFVLRDYYQFAIKHKALCLFAKAIYYKQVGEEYLLCSATMAPPKPQAYKWYMTRQLGKYALLLRGDNILGAVFLREREYALKYISKISETSKYVEDNTSAMLSLMEGEKIVYYEHIVLWYEIGETRPAEVQKWWDDACQEDCSRTRAMIDSLYSNTSFYDFLDIKKSKILRCIRHPFLLIVRIIYDSLFVQRKIVPSKDDEVKLNNYIKSISNNIC